MTEEVKDVLDEEEKTNKPKEASRDKQKSKTDDIKKLKSELEVIKKKLEQRESELTSQLEESADKYARLAAEYDNFRKRTQKERESIYGDAVADAVMGLVPIIDNLMYAEKFGDDPENPEKFADGVKLILSKLPETLEKMNVTAFGKAGESFDPEIHNAVMHVDDDSFGESEITDVLQCGYKYGDKVIRYAMVKVAN